MCAHTHVEQIQVPEVPSQTYWTFHTVKILLKQQSQSISFLFCSQVSMQSSFFGGTQRGNHPPDPSLQCCGVCLLRVRAESCDTALRHHKSVYGGVAVCLSRLVADTGLVCTA